jgi:hypothetical protein
MLLGVLMILFEPLSIALLACPLEWERAGLSKGLV